jgi:hypothetical protein
MEDRDARERLGLYGLEQAWMCPRRLNDVERPGRDQKSWKDEDVVDKERLGSGRVGKAPPRCTIWYNVAVYGATSPILECMQEISLPSLSTY